MAWLTVPALVGPLVGPPVGGFITTFFTWHWIFLINVPIGLIGIWLATRVAARHRSRPARGRSTSPASCCRRSPPPASCSACRWSACRRCRRSSASSTLADRHRVGRRSTARHAGAPPIRSSICGLFANPTFRAAIIGGTIFRIGNGAVPFLLPLMFQLGFGMTPFQSGMLTFASAFGAIVMKFLAPITLRLGGFRNVLICARRSPARSSSASMAGSRPQTPSAVIIAVLIGARLPALAVLHLDQRAGVRRHRGQGRQPGDGDLGGVAADQRGARRRGRRRILEGFTYFTASRSARRPFRRPS